jgi:antitoxin component YwqK of YwqJK toxin-antitoxin module
MTRNEQLAFCRRCTNRKFDTEQGIICRLTDKKADFVESCPDFNVDESVKDKEQQTSQTEQTPHDLIAELPDDLRDRFRDYQDFPSAIIGGLLLTLVGALIWAAITVITEYQIGYMAIGIGLLIGFGIRYFGAGVDQKFGLLGGALALLSCLMGNFFAQIGFLAQSENITYLQALRLFDYNYLPSVLSETFSPMDLLFYGFAIYEGYRFAFRAISAEELELTKNPDYNPIPPGYRLRRATAIGASVLLLAVAFIINRPIEGPMTFKYEDGSKQSEGNYVNNLESGLWHYWYPNGQLQAEAEYTSGILNGTWKLYYESGKIMSDGQFFKGTKNGVWITYHPEGQVSDSGKYEHDRTMGLWKTFFENGQLATTGSYVHGQQQGKWQSFYENGQLESEGIKEDSESVGVWKFYHQSGQPASEIRISDGEEFIQNVWNPDNVQTVKNGQGYLEDFYATGELQSKGPVKDGKRSGTWTSQHPDGTPWLESRYEDGKQYILSAWSEKGQQKIVNGNGRFERFLDMGLLMLEDGDIKNGQRSGVWNTYFPTSGELLTTTTYKDGEIEGKQTVYHESGGVWFEGMMHNGKSDGEWIWYYEDGITESSAFFENGIKTGTQKFWDAYGRPLKEETYQNGKLTETSLLQLQELE